MHGAIRPIAENGQTKYRLPSSELAMAPAPETASAQVQTVVLTPSAR
jgi:hypothetical protein